MGSKVLWLVACLALAIGFPARAEQAESGINGAAVVSDEELARNRAGFVWSGVEISLGAEMRTFLNGALVLQTNVSWTAAGAETKQFISGALTPVDAAQLQSGLLSGAGITMHVNDQRVFVANQGQTVLVQGTENGLQNVLINRASNIQISQQVDATIGLQNFGQLQQSFMASRLGDSVGNAIAQSVVGAPPH